MNTTVRTSQHPMAFTSAEFWFGAWTAWGLFLAFVPIPVVIGGLPDLFTSGAGIVVFAAVYSLVIGGFVSLLAMLAFSPVAWLLGYCLERTATRWIHIIAFAALGAGIGFVMFTTWTLLAGAQLADALIGWPNGAYAAGSALAVALGWWRTSKRALDRDDRPGEHRSWAQKRPDVDALFEDSARDS